MCSDAEWEKLRRRVEDAVESEDLRDFLSDAYACAEALIDEFKVWTRGPENAEWLRGCRARRRPEWVV